MGQVSTQARRPRQWLGVHFECCRAYSRIYKNEAGTQYAGRCPRCLKPVQIRVGSGGSSERFFRVRFR